MVYTPYVFIKFRIHVGKYKKEIIFVLRCQSRRNIPGRTGRIQICPTKFRDHEIYVQLLSVSSSSLHPRLTGRWRCSYWIYFQRCYCSTCSSFERRRDRVVVSSNIFAPAQSTRHRSRQSSWQCYLPLRASPISGVHKMSAGVGLSFTLLPNKRMTQKGYQICANSVQTMTSKDYWAVCSHCSV